MAYRLAQLAHVAVDCQSNLASSLWAGIVPTLNDFGHMGGSSSHAELLDWLAVQFRDGNRSLKDLHRLMVNSETYCQTSRLSAIDPAIAAKSIATDSDNRLLWRMNRTRLDAECIHDAILTTTGKLDLTMGGPSDRQFALSPGSHVTPIIDYRDFDVDGAAARRRGVYRFLFRTLPDPFQDALDCPSGDQITPARGNSVTVQQCWPCGTTPSSCDKQNTSRIAFRINCRRCRNRSILPSS